MNYRNFRNESNNPPAPGNFPSAPAQEPIYSPVFGDIQSTMGGFGQEFGSMNMNELLRNTQSSEEIQKQGSLTLPLTLSQKTVDDVLKDMMKEYTLSKDVADAGGSNALQKEQTMREMTLEEFLVKAGVVREDTMFHVNPNNGVFGTSTGNMCEPRNQIRIQDSTSQLNPLSVAHGAQLSFPSISHLSHSRQQTADNRQLHGIRTVGLGAGLTNAAKGSSGNRLLSDGVGKNDRDITSVPPVRCVFGGGFRGRRGSGAAEKVAERRQKRMIKNRESAARSRARKQAYTTELEAEVAKLKEENQELQKKQAEVMELRKNLVAEMRDTQWRPKKQCLRRRLTASW